MVFDSLTFSEVSFSICYPDIVSHIPLGRHKILEVAFQPLFYITYVSNFIISKSNLFHSLQYWFFQFNHRSECLLCKYWFNTRLWRSVNIIYWYFRDPIWCFCQLLFTSVRAFLAFYNWNLSIFNRLLNLSFFCWKWWLYFLI